MLVYLAVDEGSRIMFASYLAALIAHKSDVYSALIGAANYMTTPPT